MPLECHISSVVRSWAKDRVFVSQTRIRCLAVRGTHANEKLQDFEPAVAPPRPFETGWKRCKRSPNVDRVEIDAVEFAWRDTDDREQRGVDANGSAEYRWIGAIGTLPVRVVEDR